MPKYSNILVDRSSDVKKSGVICMSLVDLKKMDSLYGSPIQYHLEGRDEKLDMNSLIGREIRIIFEGVIHCTVCGKKITKTFGQGSCYDCFMNAPENAECIIRPELCRAHEGKGRDPQWEETHHNRPHYVYLALSSAVKVGVTREDQIPTRWIDQGASQGLILAECPNRYSAGILEVYLKDFFTDRTNWQRMLKNQISAESLAEVKIRLSSELPEEYARWLSSHSEPVVLEYPVMEYPEKVKSINLLKEPVSGGVLQGIKGQYLLFQGGKVINLRSHSGYQIHLETL